MRRGGLISGAAVPARVTFYICEDGLVHYCSQQRGYPGTPLETYTSVHDIRREYAWSEKSHCAPHCTVSLRASSIDFRFLQRAPQHAAPSTRDLVQIQ